MRKRTKARKHFPPAGLTATKEACPRGHPYDEENTLWGPASYDGKKWSFKCATCQREKWAAKSELYNENRRKRTDRALRDARIEAYRRREPEKFKARQRVNAAVRYSKLVKPDACEWCGTTNTVLDGSHDDYSKPLEVEWLCRQCHAAKDRTRNPLTKEQVQAALEQGETA